MRNKKTHIVAILSIFVMLLTTNIAEAAKRKVVIEDFTGAWCQACPGGILQIENFESQYGDKVIAVAVHNEDAMTIQPYERTANGALNVRAFPNGVINRIPYKGNMSNTSSIWPEIVAPLVDQNVPVEVTLDLDYDKLSGDFTATITAKVESQINSQLAFNLWAVEDYMTGTGNGWDQVNAYNNSPGTRFYQAGNPIKGFIHNNVFRSATGGVFGDTDGFPTNGTTPAGVYTKVYSGNVYDMNVDDSFNSYFVAVVQNQSTKEILNADRKGRTTNTGTTAAPTLTIAQTDVYNYLPKSSSLTKSVTVKSNVNESIDYYARISDNSIVPKGWDINFNKNFNINANGTYDLNVEVNSNGYKGIATLFFRIYARVEGSSNLKADAGMVFFGEGTDRIFFASSDIHYKEIKTILDELPAEENFGIISVFQPQQLAQLQPDILKNTKTAIFGNYELSLSIATTGAVSILKVITDMIDNGTNVLIASSADLRCVGGNLKQIPPSSQAEDFYTNKLGINLSNIYSNLKQGNSVYPLQLSGVKDDPISDGVSFVINTAERTRFVYEVYFIALNGNSTATSFIEIPNPKDPFTNLNNKVGIKLDDNGQRSIYLSIALDAFPLNVRTTLVNNMIDWLEGGTVQGAGPSISLSVESIKYGEIEVNETASETVMVSNKGDEPLIISEINFLKGTNFTVKAGTLPLTVVPEQTINVTVEFTPTAKQNYTDEITFVTNDSENPQIVLDVQGIGKLITSVPGEILNVFSMNVTPNPVEDNSVIRFNVKEGSSNVNIELIDATGKVVSNLFNAVTSGTQSVDLNASQLSSGSYYINANVDGKTTQLPVVITK